MEKWRGGLPQPPSHGSSPRGQNWVPPTPRAPSKVVRDSDLSLPGASRPLGPLGGCFLPAEAPAPAEPLTRSEARRGAAQSPASLGAKIQIFTGTPFCACTDPPRPRGGLRLPPHTGVPTHHSQYRSTAPKLLLHGPGTALCPPMAQAAGASPLCPPCPPRFHPEPSPSPQGPPPPPQ